MRGLDALLTALQRDGASTLVAFGEAAMQKGDRQLVLPGRGSKADLPQPSVDFFDRGIQPLVDRLVVGFAADIGAIELLAVEQGDHRVFEFHPRHFPRQRHVADRELVFAVCREIVFDDEAAARAERHPFDVMLLPAGAGSAVRRQGNHHVGDVAVGGRHGRSLGVADRLERDGARGGNVLVDETGRYLQGGGIVIEVALDVVVRQQCRRVDIEPEQIADGVGILSAVEAAQWHTSGFGIRNPRVDFVLEPRDQFRHRLTIRAPGASRRHETTAQLADHFLGNLGVLVDRVQIQFRQRQAARSNPVAMAAQTIPIDERTLRGDRRRTRRSERWRAPARDAPSVLAPPTRDRLPQRGRAGRPPS